MKRIAELWRYPVKSMAGESLQVADVRETGIVGDRVVHVVNAVGRTVTSRTKPKLLGYRATLGADGEPLVDGKLWRELDVRHAAGLDARLVRDDGVERFDVLPLLVATDGAIAAFGYDGRRLRPNIVISGVNGLEERQWEGKTLRTGEVVIGIQDLRERCIMTTFDPDTLVQDVDVLRKIRREFAGLVALNCYVIKPGKLAVGDPVELVTSI
jgi:MOSC domain-containing protein